MKNKKAGQIIASYIFMVIGCICYALSLRMFLIPNSVVGGGVSGVASIIEITSGLPAGLFILLINLPILAMGFKMMGWKFIVNCLITTATLSGITELITLFGDISITDNKLLASAYGGILQGIGIGCFIKYNMSSGGTELLGRITNKLIPVFSIATHVAILDAAVVITGAIILLNPENVLYALILIFISAKVSDLVVSGLNKAKLCYIITDKSEEVSDFLISHSPRGVTLLNGEGMFSKTPKGVLLTCVKFNQISALKDWVKQIDKNAFVIMTDANEVYGKGFTELDQ